MKMLRFISSVNSAASWLTNGLINSYRELISKTHRLTAVALDEPLDPWVKILNDHMSNLLLGGRPIWKG
jgi:hypothetical protein